ncbi:MAG: helix-hairpin-helix domain-containing protein, partial [Candidatus Micrarchaeaceae archaeon]
KLTFQAKENRKKHLEEENKRLNMEIEKFDNQLKNLIDEKNDLEKKRNERNNLIARLEILRESINGKKIDKEELDRIEEQLQEMKISANIIKKEQENKDNEPSLKGSFKSHSDNQIQEYIVGNLPGIGPKLAKKLLIKFKNIKNLANADVDELTKIDKIGKIKAKKIHEIINKNYAESDKR